MTTPATTTGNNNLHGTLRFLSKKYCRKSSKSSQKLLRRARRGVPTIRKSSTPRSDRLQVVSTVSNNKNDAENEGNQGIRSKEAVGGKGPLSPEDEVKVEPTAATALATNSSTGASGASSDTGAQAGEKTAKTITTTKLLHPEDLAEYMDAEAAQEEALKKIEMARQQVHSDQVQKVWGVYMYGLKHVLALNDLSNAPDAILPGNF